MRRAAAIVLGFAVVFYALVIAQALLPGVLVASLVVAAERVHAKGAFEGGTGILGALLSVVGTGFLIGYALLITQQILVGTGAVTAFLAAVWLSGSADSGSDGSFEGASGLAGN